ncbi:MAG: hypothetical protein IPM54_45025 [Polyangiaceae bacterium]|nr:hypothetical protein [Polyangiaceae bacterium]
MQDKRLSAEQVKRYSGDAGRLGAHGDRGKASLWGKKPTNESRLPITSRMRAA